MPGCTAALVLTAPVAGSSVMPVGHIPEVATVALPPAPKVAGLPFTLSLAAIFATGVDAVPEVALPLSAVGKMLAATVTVSVIGAQFAGVFTSHRL